MKLRKPIPVPAPPTSPLVEMPFDEYLHCPEMSSSRLQDFDHNGPGRFRELVEVESTPSQVWGTCFHALLLERKRLWCVPPETYTNEKGEVKDWNFNAKVCKAWRDSRPEPVVATFKEERELESAHAQALSVWQPEQGSLIERVGFGEINGVPFRCRPDYAKVNGAGSVTVVDVKTTSGLLQHWSGEVAKWGYHYQQEIYTRILLGLGFDRIDFSFLVVEQRHPHHAMLTVLGPETMLIAERWVDKTVKLYKACVESGLWPKFKRDVTEVPEYIRNRELADIGMGGDSL